MKAIIRSNHSAFTLIELLVVVTIIAIVASLSLMAITSVRQEGRREEARRQIQALVNAINEYYADTGGYPVSRGVMHTIGPHGDFTYGAPLDAVFGASGMWSMDNSTVMAILLDRERYPLTGMPTADFHHVKNTRRKIYLSGVEMVGETNVPGIGPDLVYRDPWSNPYIITFDLNGDEKCRDALYEKSSVSQDSGAFGFNGLMNSTDPSGASNDFEYHGEVMIWSLGPDRNADQGPANAGLNKDNILSWK